MRRWFLRAVPLVLVAALVFCAGCGGSSSSGGTTGGGGTTIGMNATNFVQHSISVTSGQPVHFDDTVDGGGVHVICVGTGNGGTNSCDQPGAVSGAPSPLLGAGLTINPGEKKDITFSTPGSYHVICTIHGGMFIDITVR